MRRKKPLKRRSGKRVIIDQIKTYLRAELIAERGNRCEFSGKPANGLGMFHILPEGRYPRISLSKENILLVNWFPWHYRWHHDPYYKDEIVEKIAKLRGPDWYDRLLALDMISPKLTMHHLKTLLYAYQQPQEE